MFLNMYVFWFLFVLTSFIYVFLLHVLFRFLYKKGFDARFTVGPNTRKQHRNSPKHTSENDTETHQNTPENNTEGGGGDGY